MIGYGKAAVEESLGIIRYGCVVRFKRACDIQVYATGNTDVEWYGMQQPDRLTK